MTENIKEKTEMVYVKYIDHHWYDDELTKGEVVRRTKGTGFIVEEAGLLILEDDKFVVFSHMKNHDTMKQPYSITYDSTTRILKSDIIQMQKMEIRNEKT